MAYEGEGASAARGSGSRTWYAWEGVNVPNAITVVRLALVPIYAWLHLHERNVAAMAVFAGAALSDGIDGLLARLLDQRTRLGAILDPIADKLLVATALVLLVHSGTLPLWLLLAALTRDAAVAALGVASRLRRRWIEVAPTRISKYATFTVMVTVLLALAHRAELPFDGLLPYLRVAAVLAAECLIIASVQYLLRWRSFLRGVESQ